MTYTAPATPPGLRDSRRLAGFLLLLAAILFVISVRYHSLHPAMGYLKAFSEAAMVGGLADWFAVTALFRRPLGLPIPHTAIIPRKQDKLADELGVFVAGNFLHGRAIAQRIYQARPGGRICRWLAQPANRALWQPWLAAQIPALLKAVPPQQVARLGSRLVYSQYDGAKLGQALAALMQILRQQGLDRPLLRALLQQMRLWLQQDQTRELLEENLRQWAGHVPAGTASAWDKIKAGFKSSIAERVDDWVAGQTLEWADSYLAAVLADDKHPLWQAYGRQFDSVVLDLQHSPTWHRRLQEGKQQLALSPALQDNFCQMWQQLGAWGERRAGDPQWQAQLARLIDPLLLQAAESPPWLRRIDARLAWWLRTLIERYKHHGARFVADKVKAWDSRQMVEKLEHSVGRDLQFIRINGTLVGGLAGLVIHAVGQLLA